MSNAPDALHKRCFIFFPATSDSLHVNNLHALQVGLLFFSCSVTHYQHIYFCLIIFKARCRFHCKSEANTVSDVPRQTHLAAQTPVWRGVIQLNYSWTQRETHSDPVTGVHATQCESATSAKKRESREHREGRSHASAIQTPQAGSGTET